MSEAERRNLAEIDSDDDQIETEVSVLTQGLADLARIVEAIVLRPLNRFPNAHWPNVCLPMLTSRQC